jgi:hypothetical protein
LLKTLANHLKQFMATYPLVKASDSKEEIKDAVPDTLGPNDVTKSGLKAT